MIRAGRSYAHNPAVQTSRSTLRAERQVTDMPDWITAVGEWLYVNTTGNLVASAITGTAVWLWARRKLVHLHRRLDHQDAKLHAIHQAAGGDSDAPAQPPGPAL